MRTTSQSRSAARSAKLSKRLHLVLHNTVVNWLASLLRNHAGQSIGIDVAHLARCRSDDRGQRLRRRRK